MRLRFTKRLFSQSVSLTQYVVLSVRPPACLSVPVSLLSKRPSSYCLIHFGSSSGQLGGISGAARRRKTTFDGRRLLMEDDLRWKTTLDGRYPSIKTTFDGRRPSMEDDLQWKMTFDGRRPLMEDDLRWKMTLEGRQPLLEGRHMTS